MIIQADARSIPLRSDSVQCVVTSPPYWGLRDYGTARWAGGDEGCEHRAPNERRQLPHGDGRVNDSYADERHLIPGAGAFYRDLCGLCGARRIDAQIGLEATPEAFVATMVEVFREVRRVLKDDGTLWLNLGDSYANAQPRGAFGDQSDRSTGSHGELIPPRDWSVWRLKPKDLCGMPWRVAFALQADGWYLRSDIIWAKPNPMPESVTDRPTRSHEYLFLLSKNSTYYYDADAIREPFNYPDRTYSPNTNGHKFAAVNTRLAGGLHDGRTQYGDPELGRNKRDVWTINSEATPEAHFATFPQKLVKPCILAGTSEKGECSQCDKNWVRVTESGNLISTNGTSHDYRPTKATHDARIKGRSEGWTPNHYRERLTTGWQPSCSCDAPTRPNLVFDCFLGSGTVGIVAERFGRRWAGTDLSPTYLRDIAKQRTAQMGLRL